MTQEEKARAYDKAIEKIKYVMEHGVSPVLNKEDLQDIFSELKESEDEKMIRRIIETLQRYMPTDELLEEQEMVTWLEKQGEKPQVDGFDAELNALLKKYEHLPKMELIGCLQFYLGVIQGENSKWSKKDERIADGLAKGLEDRLGFNGNTHGYSREEYINWLKSLKKRMEG